MANEALRTVFAELGINLDEAALATAEKKLSVVTKAVREFPTLRGRVDLDAVEKGTRDLQDRLSAVRVGFEQSFGQKIQGHLSRVAPGFDRIATALGLDSAKAVEFGRVFTRVSLGVVAGLAAMAVGAFAFANAFEADAAALRQTSRAAHVTTTDLQQLTAAGELAGVTADTMRGALAGLADGLQQAARGTGGPISAFHRLGVRVRDARGQVRDTSAVMDDLARALPRVQSPMRRLALAQEIFGSSARDMLAVLHTGEGGLAAYRRELEALGGGQTEEAIEASRRFGQAQVRLRYAFEGVRSNIMVAVAPAVTWVTEKVARLEGFVARVTRRSDLFRVGLVALGAAGVTAGGALLVAWAPVLVPLAGAALLVAGLALGFDDLSVFIRGGDSALGAFLDRMGGMGTAESASRGLRDSWEGVRQAIRDSGGALGEVRAGYASLEAELRPILTRIADFHLEVFRTAFGGVETSFDEVWSRIRAKALEMFDAVTRRASALARAMGLDGIARRIGAAMDDARERERSTASGRLSGLARDVSSPLAIPGLLAEWRNLLTSRPVARVPAAAANAGRGAGRTVTRTTTNHNQIHIHGPDPRAVVDELERRQRAQRDADHPLGPEEDGA